jgi:glycerol-3-phosphate acyltransferase PlsY
MMAWLLFLFCLVVAYLVGSVCSAVVVCRLFDLPDPRTEGSKNPGATNVLRLAGKKYALIVLIADMVKGLLPVLFAKMLGAGPLAAGFTCFAVVLGHMYPLYFGFKGGKGVATALGAFLGFHFMLGVMVLATWLVVANFTRYASIASMVAIIFAPFYSLYAVRSADAFLPILLIMFFVLYRHKDNMTRLMDGNEEKLNFSRRLSHAAAPVQTKTSSKKAPPPEVKAPSPVAKAAKKSAKNTVTKAKEKSTTAKKTSKAKKTTSKK